MTELATVATAQARRDRIKAGLATLWDDIKAAWRHRDWIALGYESWDAMCAGEYRMGLSLPRDERPEIVADLRAEGMSTRAIAAATGISDITVRRDLTGASNVAPVVGMDGKTYQPVRVLDEDEFTARYDAGLQDEPAFTTDELRLLDLLTAGHTVVVNMRDEAHRRLWEHALANGQAERVDRKSAWGNPFLLGEDGTRDEVCDLYETVYWPRKRRLQQEVADLRGMALGCWCAPARCHADFLAREANR